MNKEDELIGEIDSLIHENVLCFENEYTDSFEIERERFSQAILKLIHREQLKVVAEKDAEIERLRGALEVMRLKLENIRLIAG